MSIPKLYEFPTLSSAIKAFPNNRWASMEFSNQGTTSKGVKYKKITLGAKKFKEVNRHDPEYPKYIAKVILGIFLTLITFGLAYKYTKFVPSLFDKKIYAVIAVNNEDESIKSSETEIESSEEGSVEEELLQNQKVKPIPSGEIDNYYTLEKVEERYLARTKKDMVGKSALPTFKERALKIKELILSGCNPFATDEKAIKAAMRVKLSRKPTLAEYEAKLYALALIIQYKLLRLCFNQITLSSKSSEKLFGKEAFAVAYQSPKNREYLVKIEEISEGYFNKVSRVYSINEHKFYAERALTHLECYENWKREVKIQKELTRKGVPHILRIEKKVVLKQKEEIVHASIFMEICDSDLLQAVREKEGLEDVKRIEYLKKTLEALDGMHKAGIVHADIKLDNLLIKGDRLLVGDFGYARGISESLEVNRSYFNLPLNFYSSPYSLNYTQDQIFGMDSFAIGLAAYDLKYGISQKYLMCCSRLSILKYYYEEVDEVGFFSAFKEELKRRGEEKEDEKELDDTLIKLLEDANLKTYEEYYKYFIEFIEALLDMMKKRCDGSWEDRLISNLMEQTFTIEEALQFIQANELKSSHYSVV